MKFLIIILMFFIFSGLLIISNNNLALNNSENFNEFLGLYGQLINQLYLNLQILTGKIVQLDWVPK